MKSPICWVGGKSRMVKKLLPLFPKDYKCYVELFCGASWVLFGKDPSKVEVINDLDGDLVNFFRVVRDKKDLLLKSLEYELVSREVFNGYKDKFMKGDYTDEVERAKIFYYIIKASFGGRLISPTFGTRKCSPPGLNPNTFTKLIDSTYRRLSRVYIENLDFEECFSNYDGKDTFTFIDSPYRNCTGYRVGKFTDEDYIRLARMCGNSKGRWLVTINDDEYIRELFKGYHIHSHTHNYSINKADNSRTFKELIITNY